MRESRVKKRWAQGKPVLGTVAHFTDPASAELIGLMGFDCLWIDLEHQPLGIAEGANIMRAAESVTWMSWRVRRKASSCGWPGCWKRAPRSSCIRDANRRKKLGNWCAARSFRRWANVVFSVPVRIILIAR